MRSAIALIPLAFAVGACGPGLVYSDPPLAAKVNRQRIQRDNCMLTQAPQLDDHSSDIRGVARRVAAACNGETEKLLELAIPYADARAREGFQQEAERRAADIVLTFRQVDSRTEVRPVGEPTPLSK